MNDELVVRIRSEQDRVEARARCRALAETLRFSRTDATLMATAISEIARNILIHAGAGEISMRAVREEMRYGLVVTARDAGPGIRDVAAALESARAATGRLGLGLPGARRLMDQFEIESSPGKGTIVTMAKWRIRDELERLRDRRARA
jgi:serine/threonine-protein kinase RsbT